jgi:hypothetical protein
MSTILFFRPELQSRIVVADTVVVDVDVAVVVVAADEKISESHNRKKCSRNGCVQV